MNHLNDTDPARRAMMTFASHLGSMAANRRQAPAVPTLADVSPRLASLFGLLHRRAVDREDVDAKFRANQLMRDA